MDAAAATIEFHEAVHQGKEREIAALAYALAGLKHRAHLADDDIAGSGLLRRRSASPRDAGRSNRDRCGWSLDPFYVP